MSSARATVSRRCAITMAVRPASNLPIAAVSRASVAGSRRELGSSSTIRPGSCNMTLANASSCDSPADRLFTASLLFSPSGSESSQSSSPTSANARRT